MPSSDTHTDAPKAQPVRLTDLLRGVVKMAPHALNMIKHAPV